MEIKFFSLENPARFPAYTISTAGITLDYSKNQVTDDTLTMLIDLAREKGVPEQRDAMYAGEIGRAHV